MARLLRAQKAVSTLTLDAEITGETKSGKLYKYKGITSAQIVTRAKEALTGNGVLYWPEITKDAITVNGNQTAVFLVGHFINVDDPADRMTFSAWGSDTDNAGKGFMKALTNANKQVLSKALMMSTVEDESTTDVAHEPEAKPRAQAEAEALSDMAIKTWADAYRQALLGCKNKRDLARVRSENAGMMKRVPAVTQEYFGDMIASLESTLE